MKTTKYIANASEASESHQAGTSGKDSRRKVGVFVRSAIADLATDNSIQSQIITVTESAKLHNWNLIEVYRLEAVSGNRTKQHPEMKRMVRDIQRGHIKAIVVSNLSQFSTNSRVWLDLVQLLHDSDASVISIRENIDTSTCAGRLFYIMLAHMVACGSDDGRARRAAWRAARAAGKK